MIRMIMIIKFGGEFMYINCPTCNKKVKVKLNGHGRCRCGTHVKIINDNKKSKNTD